MPALLAAAIRADQHTSRIDLAASEQTHLRSAHPRIRPGFYHVQQPGQPVRIRDRIVIEDSQKWRARSGIDLINCRPEAAIFVVLDDLHIRLCSWQLSYQSLAAVIDHDYRKIPPGLRLERPDASDKVRIRHQCRNGDGYPDFRRHWIRIGSNRTVTASCRGSEHPEETLMILDKP